MIGQQLDGARSVVLLIEDADGNQHLWGVQNPTGLQWKHRGLVDGSTHASLQVNGEFRRIKKSPESKAIERAMNDRQRNELGGSHGVSQDDE